MGEKKGLLINQHIKKRLKRTDALAKEENKTREEYLKNTFRKTEKEYRDMLERLYTQKNCQSFWSRNCSNKGIECYRCREYLSNFDKDIINTERIIEN